MTRIHNKLDNKQRRRELRCDMPRAEQIIWAKLRRHQLNDVKFRRQHGVGPYVVDFYAPTLDLVVEMDGDSHFGDGAEERDAVRQAYIESCGITVIRIMNADVFNRLDVVLDFLYEKTLELKGG